MYLVEVFRIDYPERVRCYDVDHWQNHGPRFHFHECKMEAVGAGAADGEIRKDEEGSWQAGGRGS